MKATTILRSEHELILRALRILSFVTDRFATGNDEHRAAVADLLGFFREFMDDCHHAKEEMVLFPALIAAGLPARMGPIAVMLHEHDIGRGHLAAMRELLPRAAGDEIAVAELRHAAGEFALLLENHIVKENQVLFPMAERLMAESDQSDLLVAFAAHEQQGIGAQTRQRYVALLDELGARYGVAAAPAAQQTSAAARCG